MRLGFPGIEEPGLLVRALFRANHIYLLAAGLINLALGFHLVAHGTPWRRNLQVSGSILLLLAPLVLFAAFVHDPPRATPHRLLTSIGVIMLFAGTMMHVSGRTRRSTMGRGDG